MAHFTNAQLQTIKTAINADPALASQPMTSAGALAIAVELNKTASPVTLAWRTAVPPQDSDEAPAYTAFDSIVAGKRDSWGYFLGYPRNFGKNKVRNWIVDVWGSATAGSNAEAILQAGTENAKRIEVILGGTTKTTGTVSALDRNYAGTIDSEHVQLARELP